MGTNARELGQFVKAVAQELRIEAARQQMPLRELARLSDVPYPTTRKSVSGDRVIDVEELAKFAGALGLTGGEVLARAESLVQLWDEHAAVDARHNEAQRQIEEEAIELGISVGTYGDFKFDYATARAALEAASDDLAARRAARASEEAPTVSEKAVARRRKDRGESADDQGEP